MNISSEVNKEFIQYRHEINISSRDFQLPNVALLLLLWLEHANLCTFDVENALVVFVLLISHRLSLDHQQSLNLRAWYMNVYNEESRTSKKWMITAESSSLTFLFTSFHIRLFRYLPTLHVSITASIISTFPSHWRWNNLFSFIDPFEMCIIDNKWKICLTSYYASWIFSYFHINIETDWVGERIKCVLSRVSRSFIHFDV